jgi:HK97 family phage portal protein
MSWFSKELRSLASLSSGDPALARLFGSGPVASGVSVTESTALMFSAWWQAVRVISQDVASLPLILYRRLPDGGKERYVGHPLYELLHDAPNEETSSIVFRETLMAHVLTWGNGFAEIRRDRGGRPRALWPLTPDRVHVERRRDGQIIYRVSNPDGTQVLLGPDDVLHVPGLSYDGLIGYSPVQKARESIGMALAMEQFGSRYFGAGSHAGGVLQHPGRISPAATENIRQSFERRHEGVGRSHRVVVLEEGMTWHQTSIPNDTAQFLQSRKHQVTEVARWFNLPPHKLGDLERATFSNIEQQSIDYVVGTLRPWLVRWEQEILRKLISPLERRTQFAEHLIDGLLRGDAQSRAQALQVQFMNGALTIDEWRAIENRNPVAAGAGAEHFVPVNLVPLTKALTPPAPPDVLMAPPPASTNGNGARIGGRYA